MGRFEGRYLSGRPSDRRYDSAGAAEFFRCFFESGVVALEDNLRVEKINEDSAKINPGQALLDGYLTKVVATNDDPYLIEPPEGEKIGRVVLRADRVGPMLYIKEGTITEPPALERSNDVYEMSLAMLYSSQGVLNIIDEREDKTLCGVCSLQSSIMAASIAIAKENKYAIGDIVIRRDDINPGTVHGGVWEEIFQGKMPIGLDPNDEDLNKVGKLGGSKTASYTLGSGYAQTDVTSAVPWVWSFKRFSNTAEYTGTIDVTGGSNSKVESASTIRHRGISLGGSTDEGNNMPPFVVCRYWIRVE